MRGAPVADGLLTARELAAHLGMSAGWVLDEWEAGRLPGFKLGDGRAAPVRFRLSEVEAWLEGKRTPMKLRKVS
jgi:predicted DNA-binding transcriptional regulator AlpA